MEKLESEYPTEEQIKETLEAYRTGGDALMELIRKRREEVEAAESTASRGSGCGNTWEMSYCFQPVAEVSVSL